MYSKIKKVSALSKQELFFYIFEAIPDAIIKITTHAGFIYSGCIINMGIPKDSQATLVLQLIDDKKYLTEGVLHIAIDNIESVELFSKKEITNILSKGKISGEEYEISGKLEINRELQQFANTILKTCGVKVGVPQITLSEDGLVLNRIVKLTRIIQEGIVEVLKQKDAGEAWKTKFNKISFINTDAFDVNGVGKELRIYYPFNNLDASLISQNELTKKLMSIL